MAGLVLALGANQASAQRSTASIQINLTAAGGPVPAGVAVVALNTATGLPVLSTVRGDGAHMLTGLAPGEYLITATPPRGAEVYRLVRVEVGQSVTFNLDLGRLTSDAAPTGETIIVEGRTSESTTSEIAVNVSREQIESLPQSNRNFLNFAELAPGVRVSQDEFRKELISGALGASQTNVFVDGISLKSNVQQGGIVGQDASRGNPFPQAAVGGFRVITQNYKAEYEQAGSAIIASVTRSGGNEYHGELFTNFQNEDLTKTEYFIDRRQRTDPTVEEPQLAWFQTGASVSGPVVKDKLFLFLTYEGYYQDRQAEVFLNNPPPELAQRFEDEAGVFTSPFREHLGFAKFTWRPAPDQNIDITGSIRNETDVRGFGREVSFDSAENVRNRVYTAGLKHQWWVGSILNEATFQFLHNRFNPEPENDTQFGQDFHAGGFGSPTVIRVGGRDTTQNSGQEAFTFRNDTTFSDIEAAGQHTVKAGAKVSLQTLTVNRQLNGNPLFIYYNDPRMDGPGDDLTYDFPTEALYGVGDPSIEASDTQIGLYVQDDWQIGRRLTLNAGVRWDVETNPLNNDYETPQEVVDAITVLRDDRPDVGDGLTLEERIARANGPDYFDPDDYFNDGDDRPIFLGAIQPRLGLAYDVMADGKTVLFGGAGRYYDRPLFNDAIDERYRLQYQARTYRFSMDGQPRDGLETIMWQDQYLSQDGLQQMIDAGTAPNPEIFLLENDTKPLHTDQFSGGLRQQIGPVNASLTFLYARSENGLGFYPANRSVTDPKRPFLTQAPGYGNVILSADDRQSRYTSFQTMIEKPLSDELSDFGIEWGGSAAYTLAWARERGDQFNFDFPTIEDSPMVPTANDERHRLVLTGITRLPYDVLLSGLIRLGTGVPYTIVDASRGFDADQVIVDRNSGRADKFLEFRQVDLRVGKDFKLTGGHYISAFIACFNVFDSVNLGGYNGFIPPDDPANPDDDDVRTRNPEFGRASITVGPPRSFQLGAAYRF